MNITIVPYKLPDSVPTPKDECGWIALYDNKAVGWNSLLFLSYKTIKFANAYVEEEYKVITYCLPTTHGFYKDKGWEEGHTSTLFTSKI